MRLLAERAFGSLTAAPAVEAATATASAPAKSASLMVRRFIVAPRTVLGGFVLPRNVANGGLGRPTLV